HLRSGRRRAAVHRQAGGLRSGAAIRKTPGSDLGEPAPVSAAAPLPGGAGRDPAARGEGAAQLGRHGAGQRPSTERVARASRPSRRGRRRLAAADTHIERYGGICAPELLRPGRKRRQPLDFQVGPGPEHIEPRRRERGESRSCDGPSRDGGHRSRPRPRRAAVPPRRGKRAGCRCLDVRPDDVASFVSGTGRRAPLDAGAPTGRCPCHRRARGARPRVAARFSSGNGAISLPIQLKTLPRALGRSRDLSGTPNLEPQHGGRVRYSPTWRFLMRSQGSVRAPDLVSPRRAAARAIPPDPLTRGGTHMKHALLASLILTSVALSAAEKPVIVVKEFTAAQGVEWPYDMKTMQAQTVAELKVSLGKTFDVVAEAPAAAAASVYTLSVKIEDWRHGNAAKRMLIGMGSGREAADISYSVTDASSSKVVVDKKDTIRTNFYSQGAGSVGTLAHPIADKITERINDAKLK